MNSKEFLGMVNGVITESSPSVTSEAASPRGRPKILGFLQDRLDRESGQPVQKATSRVRSLQGGNSVVKELHKTSQIFANMAGEISHSASYRAATQMKSSSKERK